jgi:hypothetical protein
MMITAIVNKFLEQFDVQLSRKSQNDVLSRSSLSCCPRPEIPSDLASYLQNTNPFLQTLRERYKDHPAAFHSQWSPDFISRRIRLTEFRSDNAYIWQNREVQDTAYLLTAYYAQSTDKLGIFDRFFEDGRFGAFSFDFNGKPVSRDLLDSVIEINFFAECFGNRELRVLDIGAGYGRLGHRFSEIGRDISVMCTDAIPESSFLCDFYLKYRRANAQMVPLDEVSKHLPVDVAVNVHSFSECTVRAVTWWLELLRDAKVPYLIIVPNTGERFLSTEVDSSKLDFQNLIKECGYRLIRKRPKFADATGMDRYGLFPTWYHLFEFQQP